MHLNIIDPKPVWHSLITASNECVAVQSDCYMHFRCSSFFEIIFYSVFDKKKTLKLIELSTFCHANECEI